MLDSCAASASSAAEAPPVGRNSVAWRLPMEMKLRGGVTKWILRQVLYRHVPPTLVDRPKMGFGVPIASWLRGPLRPWADDLLDAGRLKRQGLLDAEPVQRAWSQHRSGRRDRAYELWDVLVLQAWLVQSS